MQFVEYRKMVILGWRYPIQVFENIDHLFDFPDGYFYADCFCEKAWSHTTQYHTRLSSALIRFSGRKN
ncbi:unnamed protein product [Coffea canephora]|uniref:Uncharacterized protein n=1 Tax=Coffea canephora TaxID=49390 RepID=A0A068V414_COFCA|nr:unnamed protein product [Coffea canephora]